jgi:hypothetical protein
MNELKRIILYKSPETALRIALSRKNKRIMMEKVGKIYSLGNKLLVKNERAKTVPISQLAGHSQLLYSPTTSFFTADAVSVRLVCSHTPASAAAARGAP